MALIIPKFFDVDEKHMYIGSFNLDPMSLHAIGENWFACLQ